MKNKNKHFVMITLLTAMLVAGLTVLDGCKKKSQPAAPSKTDISSKAQQVKDAVSTAMVQTNCPVMGGAIDKNIYTEYQGKKVYFCCPACKEKFRADPEKYLDKLPQFKK